VIKLGLYKKDAIWNIICAVLIVSVGIATRFWNYSHVPFTPDEFSALFRTHFDNFADLIKGGVCIDGHPPLIQILIYYLVKLFGEIEWIIKLPFTLFGVGAIIFSYLVGKQWFNHTVGLIVSAFLASMEYTVMYSQIARPYISGLFFALAMVYFWTRLLQQPEKKNIVTTVFYVLFATLCCYNHHFSLLFVALIGMAGLFVLPKKHIVKYIIINASIILLYLPNLPIFFVQFKMGGVEAWLGKPHNDWLIGFIQYLFHFSIMVGIVVIALIIMGWRHPREEPLKWQIMSAALFLLPFFIGFFYSRHVNAVLQYSSMIFSFTFLLLFLFGQIKKQSGPINVCLVSLILFVNVFTLIKDRQYYQLFYNVNFERVLLDNREAQQKYRPICSVLSWGYYMTYVCNKFSLKNDFIQLDSVSSSPKVLTRFLQTRVDTCDYLYVGAFAASMPELFPIIRDYYPYICELHDYQAATTAIFSKYNTLNHEALHEDTILFYDSTVYRMDSTQRYSTTVSFPFKELITDKNNFIDISIEVYDNKPDSAVLVAELLSKGQNIYWAGMPFYQYEAKKDTWQKIHLSLKCSDIYLNYKDIELKVYVWNLCGEDIKTRDLSIKRRDGNPIVYGLLEKIPIIK
jgi:hypothetical protein